MFTDITYTAPPPDAVPPGGYEKMSRMKTFTTQGLQLSALETRRATDFQKVAAGNIKVSCRQAGWRGKYNDKQHAYHAIAAFGDHFIHSCLCCRPAFHVNTHGLSSMWCAGGALRLKARNSVAVHAPLSCLLRRRLALPERCMPLVKLLLVVNYQ